jgi:3-hydroxy-9,10-secoandrosta-1,3,5(10)-triene-9,17-dione monooxygenase reductase component
LAGAGIAGEFAASGQTPVDDRNRSSRVQSVDQRSFRDALGRFPTGVTVVTATGPDGPAGLTTNAFTSLSLDPPLILVCFDRASRTLPVVRASGRFAVNVLRAGQEDLARLFAGKAPHPEKFAAVTHTVDHGVPVLDGALAWLVCDLEALHPGGDHEIGVGAVTALGHDPAGEPLVFHDGRMRPLG